MCTHRIPTPSTAGKKMPELRMSKSWPDPDFACVSAASGSASPGPQVLAADTRRPYGEERYTRRS